MSVKPPRKLLILDLNGTLVLRSKYGRGTVQGNVRMRAVHSRPYLTSFGQYLFHPLTMEWLDSMAWSSAQPPSVADMISKCFSAEQRQKLLAIWARDKLGLPPHLYRQKTQTTKDLAKPWAEFPSHSNRTTLLLDDSALKAHLQPDNHVCVPEYTSVTRRRDLDAAERAQKAESRTKPDAKAKKSKTRQPVLFAPDPAFVKAAPHAPATAGPPADGDEPRYDETLLAVVGILQTLKAEPDVSQWIANGGLLRNQDGAAPTSQDDSTDPLVEQIGALSLTPKPWFESAPTVDYWVKQGRHALGVLGIDEVAGIHTT